MLLETKHFGEINYSGESVIRFNNGIPGFDDAKEFIIIDSPDESSIFKWLQSIDKPQLAFAIVNPFLVKSDYDFEIKDEEASRLGLEKPEDAAVYSILVVPEDLTKVSMNLKAPIIINSKRKEGTQLVLDTDKYTVRHYILDELRRQEVAVDAGADKEKGSDNNNK